MLQIKKPVDIIIKAVGFQKIKEVPYRKLKYIQECDCEDGKLIYNVLTRELVLLDLEEFKAFNSCDMEDKTVLALAKSWFFVPQDNDDYKLFNQINRLFKVILDSNKNPPLTYFTIYSTTDCNARCFYCFELACSRISMTEQTANDVADFIIKKSQGHKIRISWFGGEPLFNYHVIDTITNKLVSNNVEFSSIMVSNGYLFDEELANKAFNKWNLRRIQITLDGTEEVYNRCKAYIYKDDTSPFLRVMNNIETLLKCGIYIDIRLNMDLHNCDDLEKLVDILHNRFGKYDKCKIYVAMLFEKGGSTLNIRTFENKCLLWKKCDEINEKIKTYDMNRTSGIEMFRTTKHCMADNNDCTTILPDGHLGKCEHFTDDNFYGSIYSDEINQENIDKFKETFEMGDFCHECPLQPKCIGLKNCPDHEDHCDEFDRKMRIRSLNEQIITSYKYYLINKNVSDETREPDDEFCS